MKYMVEKSRLSVEEFDGYQRAWFASEAKTEAGIIRAAKKAMRAKYGDDAWDDVDIHDVCYSFGRTPLWRFMDTHRATRVKNEKGILP